MLIHLQPSLQCHANSCHHLCCVTPDAITCSTLEPPDDDVLPSLVAMDSSADATLHAAAAASCHRSCNPCDVPVSWSTPVIQPQIASLGCVAATSSDVHASLMSPHSALDVLGDDTMDDVSPHADEMSLDLRFLATPSSPTGAIKLP